VSKWVDIIPDSTTEL